MKLVRAALGGEDLKPAAGLAIFGSEVRRLQFELADSFDGRIGADCAALSGPVDCAPSTNTSLARSCEPLISVLAVSPVTPGASNTNDSGFRMLPLTDSGRSRTCF